MKEVQIEYKEIFINLNYSFENVPDLDDKFKCLHCGEIIRVGDYKVFTDGDMEYICCPNAPECDGSVIDWVPIELS